MTAGPVVKHVVVGDSDDIMAALRSRGMSYPGISAACDVLLGWKLSEEHVRQRLLALGFPKNENKARPQGAQR